MHWYNKIPQNTIQGKRHCRRIFPFPWIKFPRNFILNQNQCYRTGYQNKGIFFRNGEINFRLENLSLYNLLGHTVIERIRFDLLWTKQNVQIIITIIISILNLPYILNLISNQKVHCRRLMKIEDVRTRFWKTNCGLCFLLRDSVWLVDLSVTI